MKRAVALVAGVAVLGLVATMTFASASQERSGRKLSWHRLVEAAPSSVSSNKSRDKRLVVVERNNKETDIDNPPEGFSQGDEFAATADLYRQGKKVGYDDVHGVVTFISDTQVRFEFTATATIQGDQISAVGSIAFNQQEESAHITLPVVGGTGKYDDVGGEVTAVEHGQATTLIFDLQHLN